MVNLNSYASPLPSLHDAGNDGFSFSFLTNNCAHLVYNLVAYLGVFPREIKTGKASLGRYVRTRLSSGVTLPIEVLVGVASAANTAPIDSVWQAYSDLRSRKFFRRYGVFPSGPGGLTETVPIYSQNQVFTHGKKPFPLDWPWPIYTDTNRRFKTVMTESKFTNFGENLRFFMRKFEVAKQRLRADWLMRPSLTHSDFKDFRDEVWFYDAYSK